MRELPATCQPLYMPRFDEIHARTLRPSCVMSTCHDDTTRAAGMSLADIDRAYEALRARVTPFDVSCSLLTRRIESRDPAYVMPRGAPMDEPERCVVRQWIAAGAAR